jgi:WD40 repeat protein
MVGFAVLGVGAGSRAAETQSPVSFTKDIVPILRTNCSGCHKPDKTKGDLDLTTHVALLKGGKKGAAVIPGDPEKSILYEQIIGDPPDMPEDGEPLKPSEIELIKRWIAQGAKDDTPREEDIVVAAPEYKVPPVVPAMAFSPDGSLLAVAGYHEVLIHKGDGSGLLHRLVGRAPRVESVAFSADGTMLAVCGGSPGEFGHVQIWDVAKAQLLKAYKIGYDSLYGVSFAPDGQTVAFGADKAVRQIKIEDGSTLLDFRAHADWVFGTAFTLDGKHLVSGGRDQALKYIDLENQRFIDDINNPLDQIVSFARHPKEDQVVYGGNLGGVRLYKISDNQQRTAGRNDTNLVRNFERQTGPAHAVAFSPDGSLLAVGSNGRVRVYKVADGARQFELSGHEGPVYAISWKPDGTVITTAGFDGKVRMYNAADGQLAHEFIPVPIANVAAASEQTPAVAAQ